MTDPTADTQPSQSTTLESQPPSDNKAVIGLYGVSGSGKTFLLEQLAQKLDHELFAFYDGSGVIASIVPGGLDAFQTLEDEEKARWRELAIKTIEKNCAECGKVAVVAGHFMFWPEEDEVGSPVYTQSDLDTFTHIIYLDVPAEIVEQRRRDDKGRSRPPISASHLRKWQQAEITQLRRLCRENNILFSLLSPRPALPNELEALVYDFSLDSEQRNQASAKHRLEDVLSNQKQLETVLVMDADRTLAEGDTGTLFWQKASSPRWPRDEGCPLKTLFSSPLGYSYTAFRQAAMLYEEMADGQDFDTICQDVASVVTLHPEFVSLLRRAAEQEHVAAVIITCGLRLVWEKVLEKEGLSDTVKVIGGERITDYVVVTPGVKADLVALLRDSRQMYVWAFGDSPLDLEMMKMADQSIVVVGNEKTRSKTMDTSLKQAIEKDGLRARQAVLPSNASPRLDTARLPLVQLTDSEFFDSVLSRRLRVLHATDRSAAKLLMTPMRDASVAGPGLRETHRHAGRYLAIEFLVDVVGMEKYEIPHVQGRLTDGYRLLYEQQTLIVALMRGGEPMAFGVNDVFPKAAFVHANSPSDIQSDNLQAQHNVMRTVVLVDSVINSGKTVVQFVKHIRKLDANIRIVVIAGVAYAPSVSAGGAIARALVRQGQVTVIALRLSENSFTGSGTTDTGNRLYNTTYNP